MNSKALVVLGAGLVAIVGGIMMRPQPEQAPTGFIYLLDARRDSSMPLEQALPSIRRLARIHGAKVDVRAAATVGQVRDYGSMIEEFERTRGLGETAPIFFALDQPYTTTRKALRAAVDAHRSLQQATQVQLLKRLVIVRSTEGLGERAECDKLTNDMAYANEVFAGIGLVVHDSTIQGLKECIDTLAKLGDA